MPDNALNLRIESDGTAAGTVVVDETGRVLKGVTAVYFALQSKDRIASAVIHVSKLPVSIVHPDVHQVIDDVQPERIPDHPWSYP